jgi:hypothetical protein
MVQPTRLVSENFGTAFTRGAPRSKFRLKVAHRREFDGAALFDGASGSFTVPAAGSLRAANIATTAVSACLPQVAQAAADIVLRNDNSPSSSCWPHRRRSILCGHSKFSDCRARVCPTRWIY